MHPASGVLHSLAGAKNESGKSFENTLDYLSSTTDQLVEILHNFEVGMRIAVLTNLPRDTDTKDVTKLVSKIDSNGMRAVHLNLEDVKDVSSIWYTINRSVELKLTTFVLLMPPFCSMLVIDVALSKHLTDKDQSWIAVNLNKKNKVALMRERFHVNNLLIRKQPRNHTRSLDRSQQNRDDSGSLQTDPVYTIEPPKWRKTKKSSDVKHFLRFATIFYHPLVFPLLHIPNEAGSCEVGMPCRFPKKISGLSGVRWIPACCSGLILDILQNVIKDMNVVFDLYVVEDQTFGGFHNGSWTGIVQDVYTGKADVGVHAMTQLHQRLDYVDYTEPILGSWLGIVRRREKPSLPVINWIFLTKLHVNLIIAILVVFVINFVFALVCENTMAKYLRLKRFHTRDMFSYISGLLFQRDLGAKLPEFWSSRLPCICYAIAMTIIMSTYTANLTATNIVYDDSDDFQGLSDPKLTNPSSEFKITVMGQTAYELWARTKPLLYEHMKDAMVPNDYVGVKNVLSGSLDGYIGDYKFLKYLSQLPQFCHKLRLYKEKRKSIFSAFIVPKNSPWKEPFSQEILNTFETGKMAELLDRWLWYTACEQTENDVSSFTWRYFGGLFVFTGASIGFVTLVLCLEFLVNCIRNVS
eukprot:TCONS_00007944-protein